MVSCFACSIFQVSKVVNTKQLRQHIRLNVSYQLAFKSPPIWSRVIGSIALAVLFSFTYCVILMHFCSVAIKTVKNCVLVFLTQNVVGNTKKHSEVVPTTKLIFNIFSSILFFLSQSSGRCFVDGNDQNTIFQSLVCF